MKQLDDTKVSNILRTENQAINYQEVPHLNNDLTIEYSHVPDINHLAEIIVPMDSWEWDEDTKNWHTTVSLPDTEENTGTVPPQHYFRLNEIHTPIFDFDTDGMDDASYIDISRLEVRVVSVDHIAKTALLYAIRPITTDLPLMVWGIKGIPPGNFIDNLAIGSGGIQFYLTFQIVAQAGTPDLSDAQITITPPQGQVQTLTTDATGRIRFTTRQGFVYTWSVVKEGYNFTPSTGTVEILGLSTEIEIQTYTMPKIHVVVNGEDNVGRTVTAVASSDGTILQGLTDDNGEITFDAMLDTYTVTCDYPAGQNVYPSQLEITTQPGVISEAEFTVLTAGLLKVTFVDDSSTGAQVGRRVIITPQTGTGIIGITDSTGFFQTTVLDGMFYTVEVEVPEGYSVPAPQTFTAQAGVTKEMTFHSTASGTLRVVTSPAVQGVSIEIAEASQTIVTDSSGIAEITLPTGTYTLSFTVDESYFQPDNASVTISGSVTTYTLNMGTKPIINLTLNAISGTKRYIQNVDGTQTPIGARAFNNNDITGSSKFSAIVTYEDESIEIPLTFGADFIEIIGSVPINYEGDVTVSVNWRNDVYVESLPQTIAVSRNGSYNVSFDNNLLGGIGVGEAFPKDGNGNTDPTLRNQYRSAAQGRMVSIVGDGGSYSYPIIGSALGQYVPSGDYTITYPVVPGFVQSNRVFSIEDINVNDFVRFIVGINGGT